MRRLKALTLLLAAALGVAVGARLPAPPPALPAPVVVEGHEVPASALGGCTRAIDRIYVLEHENRALRLALRQPAGPGAGSDVEAAHVRGGPVRPAILPGVGGGWRR